MTTKILSGTYSSGYTLAAAYTGVSVTATGSVTGVAGVYPAYGGGVGVGRYGGLGGAGLTLPAGGQVANQGLIHGGNGGHGQNASEIYVINTGPGSGPGGNYWEVTSSAGNGGDGGAAVVAASIATISNLGTVIGGLGGNGGAGYTGYETSATITDYKIFVAPGNAGSGAAGILFSAGGTLANEGLISGGAGGRGAVSSYYDFINPGRRVAIGVGSNGGNGGAGVVFGAPGAVVNDGTIIGGVGGIALGSHDYDLPGQFGVGGAGVDLKGGGIVTNHGTIEGGAGGSAYYGAYGGSGYHGQYNGAAGDGADVAGGTIVNGDAADKGALITGENGISLSGAGQVVNWGTIEGILDAVKLSSASDLLTAEGGSVFIGAVEGGGGTLVLLAGAPGTIGAISGFATVSVAAAAVWTLNDKTTVGAAWHVAATSDLTVTGTLTNGDTFRQDGLMTLANGLIDNGAGDTWTLANGVLLAAGDTGTFTNAGTLVRGNVTSANNIRADFVSTAVVEIGSGTLFLDGPANRVFGTVTGAGTLGFAGGVSTLEPGLKISCAAIALKGAATQVLLDESLVWSGAWNQAGGTVSVASGHTLTLAGTANKVAGTVAGAGTLGFGGGVTTLGPGLTLATAAVAIKGAATQVLLDESLAWSHGWSQAGGTVSVASGDTLTFTGSTDSFSGTVTGAGTVDFAGGSDAFKTLTLSAAVTHIGAAKVTLVGAIAMTAVVTATGSSFTLGSGGAALLGGGTLRLSGASFTAPTAATRLTNVDDSIVGAGSLGLGQMSLINDAGGLIEATGALALDPGAGSIINGGVLEANGGTLSVDGAVTGTGKVVIASGTADFTSSFSQAVTFSAAGVLELAASTTYAGKVSGFGVSGATLDLGDIAFASGTTTASYSGTTAGGVLTVTDGSHTAHIHLAGNFTASTFTLSSDGHGGTKVVDPAALVAAMAGLGGGGGTSAGSASWLPPPPVLAVGH